MGGRGRLGGGGRLDGGEIDFDVVSSKWVVGGRVGGGGWVVGWWVGGWIYN